VAAHLLFAGCAPTDVPTEASSLLTIWLEKKCAPASGWLLERTRTDSYESATGAARRFWFKPTEQESTLGSR
jgi:hypothetical protein